MANKTQRERIIEHIKEFYGADIEYLWEDTPNSGIFRNNLSKKWFGIIMDIPKKRLGFDSEDIVFILNVKCDPIMVGELQKEKGFFPAYHMNKDKWISIILDGTVKNETIFYLIKQSYDLVSNKVKAPKKAKKNQKSKERE